jgi:hypothetical protein
MGRAPKARTAAETRPTASGSDRSFSTSDPGPVLEEGCPRGVDALPLGSGEGVSADEPNIGRKVGRRIDDGPFSGGGVRDHGASSGMRGDGREHRDDLAGRDRQEHERDAGERLLERLLRVDPALARPLPDRRIPVPALRLPGEGDGSADQAQSDDRCPAHCGSAAHSGRRARAPRR